MSDDYRCCYCLARAVRWSRRDPGHCDTQGSLSQSIQSHSPANEFVVYVRLQDAPTFEKMWELPPNEGQKEGITRAVAQVWV